jgi:uncharacterized protein (DUF169 family)
LTRPAGLEEFKGTEPSGCSFWRVAAAGKSFCTVPENHFNCAVGAYRHNIPLSATRERETEQTLEMMFDLGYVKPEEVPQIPRLAKTPVAIAYAPLGDATFTPDAVLFACKPAGAVLLNAAAVCAEPPCGTGVRVRRAPIRYVPAFPAGISIERDRRIRNPLRRSRSNRARLAVFWNKAH